MKPIQALDPHFTNRVAAQDTKNNRQLIPKFGNTSVHMQVMHYFSHIIFMITDNLSYTCSPASPGLPMICARSGLLHSKRLCSAWNHPVNQSEASLTYGLWCEQAEYAWMNTVTDASGLKKSVDCCTQVQIENTAHTVGRWIWGMMLGLLPPHLSSWFYKRRFTLFTENMCFVITSFCVFSLSMDAFVFANDSPPSHNCTQFCLYCLVLQIRFAKPALINVSGHKFRLGVSGDNARTGTSPTCMHAAKAANVFPNGKKVFIGICQMKPQISARY